MTDGKQYFLELVKHPVKFRMFLFSKLPSAFFSGVRVLGISEEKAIVTVPYKWFSQNPFKSTYFACLAMAAELSTGLLAMMNTYKRNPAVSMLVVSMEANYFKKATGPTAFICEDGKLITDTVNEAIQTGEGKIVKVKSTGKNKDGDVVAEFYITWSFKSKKN
ncbi:DUF4442 domain-containing protein [Ferruginibacter sp. SUN002]|uniref:DUF4442 domain-containing protein n=1 Tax=Ferruginibacter sp. SUN002 TaxID=2937789 RepID=UPI003D360EAA